MDESARQRSAREANRIHCRETRERKRQRERLLREEVELLTLYRAIVDNGPDLFSLHGVDLEAPFSFAGEDFYERLQLAPEAIIGRPLVSIVDPRDAQSLNTVLFQVVNQHNSGAGARGSGAAGGSGSLVNLRVLCGGQSCEASMTLTVGSQGLIVVTRLYDA